MDDHRDEPKDPYREVGMDQPAMKPQQPKMLPVQSDRVDSTSDERTVNNVMRHEYRVLSEDEKRIMKTIKDAGLCFYTLMESLGNSRELSLAKTKIEEAVMWGVKHVTK